MRRHRFYYPSIDTHIASITDKAYVHQIRDVLRAKVGDELLLWKSGECCDYVFEITRITSSHIDGTVSMRLENDREARAHVMLYCALLKRENFELVLQKCTEVGVSAFVPLLTERTVKIGFNRVRCEAIIREAAEQSGRGVLPELFEPMTLVDALAYTKESSELRNAPTGIFFHTSVNLTPSATGGIPFSLPLYAQTLKGHTAGRSQSLFVGPEGGWSDTEVEHARAVGCTIASLGLLTLR